VGGMRLDTLAVDRVGEEVVAPTAFSTAAT
jgi:hypothetical protein